MHIAVLIPAHDEAAILETNAKRVWEWGNAAFGEGFTLVLSENGSRDSTAWVAKLMEKLLPRTLALVSKAAGKGGAIKRAAAAVEADVYLFMDADVSADLASARHLVSAVEEGCEMAIGSRRMPGAKVRRPFFRRLLTFIYAHLVESALGLGSRDPQCGCKAFSRRVRDDVFPAVRDDGFFFDTELLAHARKKGFSILEIGVTWAERLRTDGGSKVRVLPTGFAFIKKILALRKELRRT